ncbi:MAG TPA: hypothetical protein VFV87_16595 [Pirellulaceae bacterium]|nr:hypothetical protein [Pirellulaceae bacterium]
MADYVEVPEGTMVRDLLQREAPSGMAENYVMAGAGFNCAA